MGGHPAGHLASRLAATELAAILSAAPDSRSSPGVRMAEAVARVDARIRGEALADPERAGMGTTLTALQIEPALGRLVIGHVGDSRAYLYQGGRLRQLTRDHTWVQQQIDAGRLDPGEAREHPWSHVLSQALGVGDPVACEVIERRPTPGEIYLLCTDGLTTMLHDVAIERALADGLAGGLEAAARSLVERANDRGGADNVTVVLIAIEPA